MAKKRQHRLPGPKLKMPDLVVLGHLTDQQARVSLSAIEWPLKK